MSPKPIKRKRSHECDNTSEEPSAKRSMTSSSDSESSEEPSSARSRYIVFRRVNGSLVPHYMDHVDDPYIATSYGVSVTLSELRTLKN